MTAAEKGLARLERLHGIRGNGGGAQEPDGTGILDVFVAGGVGDGAGVEFVEVVVEVEVEVAGCRV